MIKSGIGRNNNIDSFQAGKGAVREAIDALGGEKPDVIIAFTSISYDQEQVLKGINSVSLRTPVVGGTSGWGTITGEGPGDKDVAVIALKFEKTKVAVVSATGIVKDPQKVGNELGEALIKEGGGPPKLAFVFNPVLGMNIDLFAQGLEEKIGKSSSVVGGGVGDDMVAKSSGFEYHNDKVLTDSVVALGLWGDISFSFVGEHGWEAIGVPEEAKTEGNIVYEIGGKPAIHLYEKYFDKSIVELEKESLVKVGYGYPLGIIPDKEGENIIVRQVIAAKDGSIITAGSIPDKSKLCIMYADSEKMIEIDKDITKKALAKLKGEPQVAFMWNCVCRKTLLMPDHKREIEAVSSIIGKEVPLFGFYTYGEWGMGQGEKWTVLNETMVLTLLYE